MTLISLTDSCRLLAIDAKTLRRWLALAHFPLQPHPTDARIKGVTADQLRQIAAAHRRTLADLPEALPPLSRDLINVLRTLPELSAQITVLQQRLADLTPFLHPIQVPASPSQEEPTAAMGEPTPAPRPRPATSSSAKQPPEPARVLP